MNHKSIVGIRFLILSGIGFIALKFFGIIDWSWWFITLPLWIIPCVAIIISFIYFAVFYFKKILK
jgi:hypothetical protein